MWSAGYSNEQRITHIDIINFVWKHVEAIWTIFNRCFYYNTFEIIIAIDLGADKCNNNNINNNYNIGSNSNTNQMNKYTR